MSPRVQNRGSAAVEFGLAFVFFFTMVIALVELGRGAWAYSSVAHATRQGARFAQSRGSLNPATNDQIAGVVKSHAMGLDPNLITVTTTYDPSNNRGNTVQVSVAYNFPYLASSLLFTSATSGAQVTMRNTSRMIIAN